jgi:hypothetical protein
LAAAEAAKVSVYPRFLSARDVTIVTALADAVAAPCPPLPQVAETDTILAFDRWLAHAPPGNRAALRVGLHVLDLSPLVTNRRRRLHSLTRDQRIAVLEGLERIPVVSRAAEALRAAVSLSYFGDARVMRALGYDPDERVARGRELRRLELRP